MKTGMTANDNGYEYKELDREKIWVICEDCELLRSFDGKAVKAEFTAAPAPSIVVPASTGAMRFVIFGSAGQRLNRCYT